MAGMSATAGVQLAAFQGLEGDPVMASLETESVTRLIRAAQCDRESAVGPLLAVYFERLVQLARKRLQDLPGMAAYDEDLALRSFYSVYRRLRDRERPLQLAGRDDLWRLLAARTISRAIDLIHQRQRRSIRPNGRATVGGWLASKTLGKSRTNMPADVGPQVVALEHMTVAELGCTCKPAMPRRRLTRSSVSWAKPLNKDGSPAKRREWR